MHHHQSNIGEEEQAFPEEERKEKQAIGTMIIPPKESITIQGVLIRNLTDFDLEFWLRLDEKLRELAISKIK